MTQDSVKVVKRIFARFDAATDWDDVTASAIENPLGRATALIGLRRSVHDDGVPPELYMALVRNAFRRFEELIGTGRSTFWHEVWLKAWDKDPQSRALVDLFKELQDPPEFVAPHPKESPKARKRRHSDDLEAYWDELRPKPIGCSQCGREYHRDGTEVEWLCASCNLLVCRECTLTEPPGPGYIPVPYPGGIRYLDDTLCSRICWERAGKPCE